jgi:hypothetical protein
MAMEDIFKNIKIQIIERTSSPLMGGFLISWCLWNYKFLIILASKNSVTVTFSLADKIAFPHWWSYLLSGLVFPIITCLIYIYAYPYPAKKVYTFWREKQKDLNEVKKRIESEVLLTIEESRQLRDAMSKMERDYLSKVDAQASEIRELKQSVYSLEIIQTQEEKSPIKKDLLSDAQTSLLSQIANSENGLFDKEIKKTGDTVKTMYDLGELEKRGLLTSSNLSGGKKYKPTHAGRSHLVNNSPTEQ